MSPKNYVNAVFIVAALIISCKVNTICLIEEMNKNIARITQKIDRLFRQDWPETVAQQETALNGLAQQPELKINQEGDTITVTIHLNKEIKDINAQIGDNQLFVEIAEKNQHIFFDYEKESNYLAISMGRSTEKKKDMEGAHQEEAFFSSMQRGQTLTQSIEFDKTKIEYQNGILTVFFPKTNPSKVKKASKKIKVYMK